MSITGELGGKSIKPGPTIGDTGTGMLMAFSIVSALFDRTRTGKGRRLQVAMQDSVMMCGMFVTQARTGAAAPRRPPGGNPPSGIFACAPGGANDYVYILTSRANPEHWPRLLKLIGREDLIGDARYATPDLRLEREAEVNEIVTGWTSQRSKHEAMAQLSGVGVPAGAVLDSMEITNEPSWKPWHSANDDARRALDGDDDVASSLRRRTSRSKTRSITGRTHRRKHWRDWLGLR